MTIINPNLSGEGEETVDVNLTNLSVHSDVAFVD